MKEMAYDIGRIFPGWDPDGKWGLVLEGGGMRGVYSAGVTDVLSARGVRPDYLIGVSAGASVGASFVSGQVGRALRTYTHYIGDRRYLSAGNLLREGSLFGMDFLYDVIPNSVDPFDYEAFMADPMDFTAVLTDVYTGQAVYEGRDGMERDCALMRASASLPGLSPPVDYRGGRYLDGGVSDSIPYARALEDGCERVLVVLTQPRGFRKKPQSFPAAFRAALRRYPRMAEALERRHLMYNAQLDGLARLEREGVAAVIAPSRPMGVGRTEKGRPRLMSAYILGRADATAKLDG